MPLWVAWLRAILVIGLGGLGIALGISDLITGHATGGRGRTEFTRSDSPIGFWITTGLHFLIGIAVVVVLVRALFSARNSSDDDQ